MDTLDPVHSHKFPYCNLGPTHCWLTTRFYSHITLLSQTYGLFPVSFPSSLLQKRK
jgi:hypothetical protein